MVPIRAAQITFLYFMMEDFFKTVKMSNKQAIANIYKFGYARLRTEGEKCQQEFQVIFGNYDSSANR